MVFHWSFSDSKTSPFLLDSSKYSNRSRLFRGFECLILPLISCLPSIFSVFFDTDQCISTMIGITGTFIFHNFFHSLVFIRLLGFFHFLSAVISSSGLDWVVDLHIEIPDNIVYLIFLVVFWFVFFPFGTHHFLRQFLIDCFLIELFLSFNSFATRLLRSRFMCSYFSSLCLCSQHSLFSHVLSI